MRFRDRTTGQIHTLFDIQQKFSNVSFPNQWTSDTYDFANVDSVVSVPAPVVDTRNRPEYVGVQFVGGVWQDVWAEVPKYDDPFEQEMWVECCLAEKWGEIKAERNNLLSASDYTQLPDSPISPTSKAAFITYRQQLRDITNQPDPYNIIWPELPIYEKE